jgi:hypothetical protein
MWHARLGNGLLSIIVIVSVTACSKSRPKLATAEDSLKAFAQFMDSAERASQAPRPAVPSDLVPVAFASAQSYCRNNGFTCKDFEVAREASKHREHTAADKANGYEDRWCVHVTFPAKGNAQTAWKDSGFASEYVKQGGVWKIEEGGADGLAFGCIS